MNFFRELARHLFSKYDVPPCFESVWFSGDGDDVRRQQAWYRHVGGGGNLRTAPGLPCKVSKRMAHHLSQSKFRRPLLKSMRWSQVEAFGAEWRLASTVARSQLGETFENEDFWITVIHFFINNPFLERTYVDPVVDYIQAHKYSPRRIPLPDGSVALGPPLHSNFAMKGRSAGKLLALVDDWHEDLSDEEDVVGESWDPSGIELFELEEADASTDNRLRWRIVELGSSRLLRHEGKVMHHCVGSYARRCVTGERSIWSLRVCVGDDDVEKHILTIAVDNKRKFVTQARGKYNMQPFDKARTRNNQQDADRPYVSLLRESARVMRTWMGQEGLRHGK
jgi:hypothetical protein